MSKTIRELIQLDKVDGDYGIEIEMELDRFLAEDNPVTRKFSRKWRVESDGSLRGASAELVLRRPVEFDGVKDSLAIVEEELKYHKCEIQDSFRAGVHVHMNVQEWTIKQLHTFLCLYYTLEVPLTQFCGEDRVGNHFCLRRRDAENVMFRAISFFSGRWSALHTDNVRYCALNLRSLYRYGSLEFRAMRTDPDLNKVYEWVEIIERLKRYSLELGDASSIPGDISGSTPEGWARHVLGEEIYEKLYYPTIGEDIFDELRSIQELIFNGVKE